MFASREQAGRFLAPRVEDELKKLPQSRELVVIGLPRGGVPVAEQLALYLDAPLTVLAAKKIGAKDDPEVAIGAVTSSGVIILNGNLRAYIEQEQEYVEQQIEELIQKTKESEQQFLDAAGITSNIDLKNKRVIIVDDGIATGMTTLAAVRSAKQNGASEVILASPIIANHAIPKLKNECDIVIALLEPEDFEGIGQFYRDFHQLEDFEVVESMRRVAVRRQMPSRQTLMLKNSFQTEPFDPLTITDKWHSRLCC